MIGDKDIYLLAARCKSRAAIQDFRTSESRRRPRYAAMIAPSRIRGNTESEIWSSSESMDSALTSDPRAYLRGVYFSVGAASSQFGLSPPIAEVRVLNDSYRLAGATCGEDPVGLAQTHTVPCPIGRVSVISDGNRASYSWQSHLPCIAAEILRGAAGEWPRCAESGEQPPRGQKLVILGGHIAILDEEAISPLREWVVERSCQSGIIRHILRANHSHFESNLPSRQRLSLGPPPKKSREGGRIIPEPGGRVPIVHSFFPDMTSSHLRRRSAPAVVPGIVPRPRTRYLDAWYRWGVSRAPATPPHVYPARRPTGMAQASISFFLHLISLVIRQAPFGV